MNFHKFQSISKYLLLSILIGLTAAIAVMAFTGPGSNSPGEGNPDFWIKSGDDVYYTGGKVGIGDSVPDALLDLSSTEAIDLFRVDDDGDGDSSPFIIDQNGKVGIGTTEPATNLHIYDTDADASIKVQNNAEAWFFAVGTTGTATDFSIQNDASPYHRLVIDTNGNVGIGTTGPGMKLEVMQSGSLDGLLVTRSGASGNVSILGNNGGDPQIRFNDGTNEFAVGIQQSDGSFRIHDGTTLDDTEGTTRLTILSNGNVGIGTTDPEEKLTVAGTVKLGSDGSQVYIGGNRSGCFMRFNDDLWFSDPQNGTIDIKNGPCTDWGTMVGNFNAPSSIRWKKNIKPIEDALDKIMRLRGVSFDWKENGKHDIGLIAEEVGEVIPEVVNYENNGKDAASLSYARLVAVLIEAIKIQQQEIDNLKREVTKPKL